MRLARAFILPVAAIALCHGVLTPASAREGARSDTPCPDAPTEFANVVDVGADLTLSLSDGRVVSLPGLESPRATVADPERPQWVHTRLLGALKDQTVGLAVLGGSNRWGAIPMLVFTEAGDLAEQVLDRGDVRFRPDRAMHACRGDLLVAESRAREAQRGVWSDPSLMPIDAGSDLPKATVEGMAIVEGTVASAGETATRLYLNLGRERGGFAISVPKRDIALMQSGAVTKARIKGTRVRVRGLVDRFAGWRIDLSDADAIEILSPVAAEPASGAR